MDNYWQQMAERNQSLLASGNCRDGFQAVTVLTSANTMHCLSAFAADCIDRLSKNLITLLQQQGTPVVTAMLCQWHGGELDLPHHALRKALLALHKANADARILMLCQDGYTAIPLNATLPGK